MVESFGKRWRSFPGSIGIAAVVIVVIMLIKTYMDTNGQDQVDSIFVVLFENLLSWFSF